jgi:hypothetical protein
VLGTLLYLNTRIHALSGSSFVRIQQQLTRYPNDKLTFSLAPKPEELWELTHKNRQRMQGSKNYLRAWRHWVTEATAAIREDLSMNLPYPVQADELVKLSFELGVAADKGSMPSFANPGARAGYALDYFCRARLLAGFLVDTENESLPSFWMDGAEHPESSNNAIGFFTGKAMKLDRPITDCTISLTSIGGGPGFDFVAVALVATFASSGDTGELPNFRATILDYEEGWGDLVRAMGESTKRVLQPDTFAIEWGGKCDITQPLAHPNNAACTLLLANTDMWTCQYCVAENAHKLRASEFIFFQDLWNQMPVGSTMILTETTPRLWPEFYDVIQKHCPFMEVGFPNQRPQLLLRKRSPTAVHPTLSARDQQQLRNFREISAQHEKRNRSGWERQVNRRMKETRIDMPQHDSINI